ncbi:hypothetical protein Tco_0490009 [Tanacetum coccineum]
MHIRGGEDSFKKKNVNLVITFGIMNSGHIYESNQKVQPSEFFKNENHYTHLNGVREGEVVSTIVQIQQSGATPEVEALMFSLSNKEIASELRTLDLAFRDALSKQRAFCQKFTTRHAYGDSKSLDH